MENLLAPILTNKGREVAARKALRPAGEVRAAALEAVSLQPRRPFAATLAASPTGIIAEFKRKSPSLGWIRPEARVEDVVTAYERAGATAPAKKRPAGSAQTGSAQSRICPRR